MNDTYFIIIQLIGLEGLILLVCSYYKKNTNKILVIQMLATLCYALHYVLLGAYSGFLICIIELLRDFTYYKTNKDKYIFLFSIPIYVIRYLIKIYSFCYHFVTSHFKILLLTMILVYMLHVLLVARNQKDCDCR